MPANETVRNWMTADPITVSADASLPEADKLMKELNIRRLAVMQGNALVGIVTRGDMRGVKGGGGCICPKSVMLKQLITYVLLRRDEIMLLDMYAGVEHLGRATADAVDAMIIVVEPSARSVVTAAQIKSLANDIGIPRLYVVGNKAGSTDEQAYIEAHTHDLAVLGHLPFSLQAQQADRQSRAAYDEAPAMVEIARAMLLGMGVLWKTKQPTSES